MPKAERTVYTFKFEALPHNMIEARRIARFLKEALRFYGLKLITMEKKETSPNEDQIRSPET